MATLHPASTASRSSRLGGSNRSGRQLTSTATSNRRQAANTMSASNADSGRTLPPRPWLLTLRPVQCPSTSVCGLAMAAPIRGVISAAGIRSLECTLATTKSSSASSSGSWSRAPSSRMSHSMPVRTRKGDRSRAVASAAANSSANSSANWAFRAARAIGHDYMVLTDHSPRLTVARGLSAQRLSEQLDVVAALNAQFAEEFAEEFAAAEATVLDRSPFRILTGIECDILDDGALDQEPELLAELDLVVASVHSKLRMPAAEMTPRMVAAIANPHTDVLGHCTGRNVSNQGRGGKVRPESAFDADIVFAAC